ncbi:Myomesin-2 [Plecturocebus cupreus]
MPDAYRTIRSGETHSLSREQDGGDHAHAPVTSLPQQLGITIRDEIWVGTQSQTMLPSPRKEFKGHRIPKPLTLCSSYAGTKEISAGVDEEGNIYLAFDCQEMTDASQFTWCKSYEEIVDDERFKIETVGDHSKLYFKNPDKEDLGTYSVSVSDTDGVSSSFVLDPEAIPLKSELAYEIFDKGQVRFWLQAEHLSPDASYRFIINDREVSDSEAGVQWHILAHCNLRLLGSTGTTGARYHTRLIFLFLVETGFYHVGQVGLKLQTSGDPPTLASQSAGITGMNHCTQPKPFLKIIFLPQK